MYLEKEALEQEDREDFVPFTGEKKGKDMFWDKGLPMCFHWRAKLGNRPESGK